LLLYNFRACYHINTDVKRDVRQLFQQLSLPIARTIQYNKDNRYYSNMEAADLSITSLCDIMLDKSLGNPVCILLIRNSVILINIIKYNYKVYICMFMIMNRVLLNYHTVVGRFCFIIYSLTSYRKIKYVPTQLILSYGWYLSIFLVKCQVIYS